MFDRHLIVKDSLKNTVVDGKVVGFQFDIRQGNYRGSRLSLYNGVYCVVDGTTYPRRLQKIGLMGKVYTLDEIKKDYVTHWDYDDAGTVYVEKEGGLAPGQHVIIYAQSIYATYGFRGMYDELNDWVYNDPEPGNGNGECFVPGVRTFVLDLKD